MDRLDNLERDDAVAPATAFEGEDYGSPPEEVDPPSLVEDLRTLASDGKTYLEAELAFQKSRAGFVAGRARASLVHGAAALAFVHLALIALTVGAVLSLATLVGPLAATGIVVAVLLLGALFFALKLRRQIAQLGSVFGDEAQ